MAIPNLTTTSCILYIVDSTTRDTERPHKAKIKTKKAPHTVSKYQKLQTSRTSRRTLPIAQKPLTNTLPMIIRRTITLTPDQKPPDHHIYS
ncbi:uncharacterized protein BDW43DRAFT_280257 [Aspergillus alliaceus]|uniref:uncharacterized protein n=1 Tax=Petromyces alliaceus TaxID=209559 RepID=UPI0012A5A163|nr:uncharacterized protein BDW43DRAFT_280257 [Aspergillus alliaceus]KAB8232073.1 hypothetical protein BDW43DRAFT_280257 [Aspergillus alliaceus]